MRRGSRRFFSDEEACGGDLGDEVGVQGGVGLVDPAGEEGDGSGGECAFVGGGVDAAGEAGDDGETFRAEVLREAAGHAEAE